MSDDPLHQPISTREQALDMLGALWEIGTPIGNECLIEVVGALGYADALTDEALIRLARRQQGEDKRLALIAEAGDAIWNA